MSGSLFCAYKLPLDLDDEHNQLVYHRYLIILASDRGKRQVSGDAIKQMDKPKRTKMKGNETD